MAGVAGSFAIGPDPRAAISWATDAGRPIPVSEVVSRPTKTVDRSEPSTANPRLDP